MLPSNRPPVHPGEIVLEEFLKPLNLSQEQLAKYLGGTWTQSKISDIINKKRKVTESIALDFGDVFGTSSEFWINLQYRYDLWFAQQSRKPIARLPQLEQLDNSSPKKN
ncbi:HigA family addiction module antidote protein [Candidatus Dependentiae bacterium]|nr:HigA family addiction module antidote protein [Candidatus Dependentiae bacterium]